jgi:AcrR family transcriptional regulator
LRLVGHAGPNITLSGVSCRSTLDLHINTDQYGGVTAEKTRRGVPTRTAVDWEEGALDVMAARGVAALSIPDLARSLNVTKGSFYWHFSGLDDLVTRSISRWEASDKTVLEQIRRIEKPAARLRTLFAQAMAAERAQRLFLALSLWPGPGCAAVLRRVSVRRLRLLVETYRELGLPDQSAQQQGLLAYSAYIGGVHLRNADTPWLRTPEDLAAYVEHAARTLVGSARKK